MSQRDPFYRFVQWLPRTLWRALGKLEVHGLANIPESGPVLLLANHQSILDPILIQAVIPRHVHAMAKSTQFASPFMGWLMPRLKAFPVRRYQIDPQAVRVALRRLQAGEVVGIYVEGERSWDARLQEPRRGTIRIALHAGVLIVPATITGSYDVWPRWHRGLRLEPVRIDFGPAFRLPTLKDRADRDAALEDAAATIMGTLERQLRSAGGWVAPRAKSPNSTSDSTADST
ncbi:MAG: lysophospholipid acyltransferase family protein [Longimicrobiales bacterium]